MNKSASKEPSRLSNKENRATISKETPHQSTRNLDSSTKDRVKSSKEVFKEHDSNIKPYVRSTESKTEASRRLEEEMSKNERLETQIEFLLTENKNLKETLENMNTDREEYEELLSSSRNFQNVEEKARKLENELNKNMERILNYDRVVAQLEEERREKDRMAIHFEKEKAALTSRIIELKEQLNMKDDRIEQRINDDHNNRYMLNANLNKALDQNEKWKKLYMMEAKNIISLQHQYKSLIEDNKCHMEYIAQLENKIQESETKYYDLYTDYHQRLTDYRIENLKNVQAELERIKTDFTDEEFKKVEERMMIFALQNELNKEKEVSFDFKGQINKLLDIKQELERNLALSRHNALELTGKLEEECAKVAALEDMRINDLQYIANLENGF